MMASCLLLHHRSLWALGISLFVLSVTASPGPCFGEDPNGDVLTLGASIEQALARNTRGLSAREGVAAAEANKQRQFTQFLPRLSTRYAYTRLDEDKTFANVVTRPQDQYQLRATLDQPVFSGFSNLTQYEISSLGLQTEQTIERQTRQDLVLEVKRAYFQVLQKEKLEMVAAQAVTLLEAQLRVAKDFYNVGITPRNDVLEAEVELANAQLDLIVARNDRQVAESQLNTLLRRPVDAPVDLEDVLTYDPFTLEYEEAVKNALSLRTEIQVADLAVETAEKEITLTKRDYYPAVDLQANYYRAGDDPAVDGGEGITDRDEWDVMATLSWTLWEWGKTRYGVQEKRRRQEQARLERIRTEDAVRQEVKAAYLTVKGAESAIVSAEKAVEQAEENFRIFQERYKEQVATSTDVLDARFLLTRSQNNLFNALSAYNISKAALDRAMGIDVAR